MKLGCLVIIVLLALFMVALEGVFESWRDEVFLNCWLVDDPVDGRVRFYLLA